MGRLSERVPYLSRGVAVLDEYGDSDSSLQLQPTPI
jgi:hypothetical protein